MLQLTHRDHTRHITLPLSRSGSVSTEPRHASMQVLRPIPGCRRSFAGSVHLILTPLGDLGWVIGCTVAALGACFGAGCGADVPGCRDSDGGMCGRSSVRMSSSKLRGDMLWKSMSPAYYYTLMHQVLKLRVRRRRKFIRIIFYSAAQSTLACLSLALWRIRDRRSTTRSCVSNHSIASRETSTLATASAVTQLTWNETLSFASRWADSAIEGRTLHLNAL